ncbi:MAG: hypothetical protein E6I80_29005 [Chloroflexi bacterium]|nr:MAG: hypothetical protein E6I80_29005 [Chloroflexota bacterium]
MLTAVQFQDWCTSLHPPGSTWQVLKDRRTGGEVRRVGSRASNVSGAYASRRWVGLFNLKATRWS